MASTTSDLLQSGAVFLAAAVLTVPLAQRAGLGSVIGYLLAGVAIGPWGLGLINDVDAILHFAEFGVVLLLFLIGLELNPKKLWQMRIPILGLGGAQVIVTTSMLASIISLCGIDWRTSLVIGVGLAMSSTAIALRLLEEHDLSHSETGQTAFSVLLFQDIAVIPVLALMPLLAGNSAMTWLDGIWMLAGIVGLMVGGHYLLNPIFRYIILSGVRELFTIAALLLVIGIALMMEHLGLSMALGAFIAGVLLAESEFRHELEIAVEPFKGLLLGLFFIAVGMSVDLGLLVIEPWFILGSVVSLVVLKGLILYILARIVGTGSKARSNMAAILSQGGEFAFVIFTAARSNQLLTGDQVSLMLVIVSLSMVTTPLLLAGQRRWFARELNQYKEDNLTSDVEDKEPRVIIAGFGRFGQIVGRLMFANKIDVTVLESDASQIRLLRKFGYQVFYGDAANLELLRAAGAEKAEAIVICTDAPDEVMKIVELCQQHFPQLKILARARSRVEAYQLINHEVAGYSRETFLGALDLGRKTLVALGMHPYKAKRAEAHFRRLDTAMLTQLLPYHMEDKKLTLRAKEARQELEEIFGQEMENERNSREHWDQE
ncbi:glutathione-regulated potassium-efflux system protein KefB [Vibrio porteresiae]|uniref:Glutathione-regulated potassium-efflux system protein KefB n=1 Tax=Vibrio porteresiae DSM 19223 TaxID=1123496 RepID=A0ABZ0QE36_9VIBR|nr:glutathione-regulated potassium-efflux system protein KefB [Vibrio porteresiae]WPC73850.1 glutathione-regulated potassium-efflux system protein KefB [Vibrio porteresiae DSM 19223]